MRRKLISVRVNPKILKIAKETGLNVSKACENGLKQQIQRETLSKLAEMV
jgi:post-segregation antitoxin (ccd killing protein)